MDKKTIDLPLSDVIEMHTAILGCAQKPFRGKVAYGIHRLFNQLHSHVVMFENTRTDIIKAHGTPDGNEGFEVLDDEKKTLVRGEIYQILTQLITIDIDIVEIMDPVQFCTDSEGKDIDLQPSFFAAMSPLFKIESSEN